MTFGGCRTSVARNVIAGLATKHCFTGYYRPVFRGLPLNHGLRTHHGNQQIFTQLLAQCKSGKVKV